MDHHLKNDLTNIDDILAQTVKEASEFLTSIPERAAGAYPDIPADALALADDGVGAKEALALFKARHGAGLSGSTGPRYFGFVTGGSTPAALMGDWLTSTFDQNSIESDIAAAQIEREAIQFLVQLFGLPETFTGVFVTGATMSNFVGLAQGRQWVARQLGIDVGSDGLYGLLPIKILSGSPHSTILKALAMLGMGRNSVQKVDILPEREAVDIKALRRSLDALDGQPCIVVGNAGTVNTVDFDDLPAIAALKDEYKFWLHVDGAFGGFAAATPTHRHLITGLEHADSFTVDAHKWLNVPYDAAMIFTRHQDVQIEVFKMNAAYLGESGQYPDLFHLTPESSRRLRALPAWFSLMAYGRNGHTEIVERNSAMAKLLGEKIEDSLAFRLLAPVRMNVVCFTLNRDDLSAELVDQFADGLTTDGRTFMTPTIYKGTPGIRAAISNWRTEANDIDITWQAMMNVVEQL